MQNQELMHQEHGMLILCHNKNTDMNERRNKPYLRNWTAYLMVCFCALDSIPPIFTAHLTKSKCFLSLPAILIYVNQLSQAFSIELIHINGQ